MRSGDDHYVHGTHPEEQRRLARLNRLLNAESLRAMNLQGGERILDAGSGLGMFARLLARTAGPEATVIGVERDAEQLAGATLLAVEDKEEGLVEFRQGSATSLPLTEDERGTFDVVHARFLLEHLTDPVTAVREMVGAARPGGRIILEDDDHDLLRLWPEPPGVSEIWRAYYLTYERQGKDPFIGRRLVSLLHEAGARPVRNLSLPFGSCAGHETFDVMVENFAGILEGARAEMVAAGLAEDSAVDAAITALRQWKQQPDAALWYCTAWAEGVRPAGG